MGQRITVLCVGALMAAAPAWAADVFFNGVKVTGAVIGQTFDQVKVEFDGKGDVHITAAGYKVEPPPAQATALPPPPVAAVARVAAPAINVPRYWLVLNAERRGHYKVQLRVNGQAVADVPADAPQYVADVTDKLFQGDNQVEVTFLPVPNAPVGPTADAVTVILGHGAQAVDGTLTIQRVLGTAKQASGSHSALAQQIRFTLQE